MKKFLGLAVVMLLAVCSAAAQQSLLPINSHFTILNASSGGFCYLTELPLFAPNGAPAQIKIHGISIGQASGFGNLRIDHFQTVSFDSTGAGTISDATMVLSFTDGVVPPSLPDTLTLSYAGTGAPPNAFDQGTMSGTFTVMSGTGRFASMSGRGVWAGSVSLAQPPVFWSATDFMMVIPGNEGLTAVPVPRPTTPMCAVQGRFVGFLTNEGRGLR